MQFGCNLVEPGTACTGMDVRVARISASELG